MARRLLNSTHMRPSPLTSILLPFRTTLCMAALALTLAPACSADMQGVDEDRADKSDSVDEGADAGSGEQFDLPGTESSSWSCDGTAGTSYPDDGVLFVTSFGCWTDSNGGTHGDGDDNCIPWCQNNADEHGTADEYDELCGGMSGPECERSVNWYVADADRYGCMTRLRVTNPDNGKAAVVVVLDRGPSCFVEERVDHWVLDLSTPASLHLFGEQKSATERGDVIVEVVPSSTPLGPV